MTIVSMNLGKYNHWHNNVTEFADFINSVKPDILLLQEVKYDPKMSAYNQAVSLNRQLVNSFRYEASCVSRFYKSSKGDIYKEGLATPSHHPITKNEVLVLTKRDDDKHTRIMQNSNISVNDITIKLSNIHLSNNDYSYEQLDEILVLLKARGEKRIIAGDFNIADLQKHLNHNAKEYTVSTAFSDYISFPAENKTFDYMLLPTEYTYIKITTASTPSDHNAVVYEIQ